MSSFQYAMLPIFYLEGTCGPIEDRKKYLDFLDSGGFSKRVPKVMNDVHECRMACVNRTDCTGFTFYKDETKKDNCGLISVSSNQKYSTCCESGQVSHECRRSLFSGMMMTI